MNISDEAAWIEGEMEKLEEIVGEEIKSYGEPSFYLEGWYTVSGLKEIIEIAEKRAEELKKAMERSMRKIDE